MGHCHDRTSTKRKRTNNHWWGGMPLGNGETTVLAFPLVNAVSPPSPCSDPSKFVGGFCPFGHYIGCHDSSCQNPVTRYQCDIFYSHPALNRYSRKGRLRTCANQLIRTAVHLKLPPPVTPRSRLDVAPFRSAIQTHRVSTNFSE